MSYYRDQLERWLETISISADNVLDIGGAANPVKNRVKSWDVKHYMIADNLLETPKDPSIPVFEYDLNEEGIVDETDWDVIFCLEVFEYIYDPVTALDNIQTMLGSEGIAYISFPSIYPVHEPKENDYMRFTRHGIVRLLDTVGFSEWSILPRIATIGKEALGQFYSLEGMHPVKHDDVIYHIGYLVEACK
jgi:SAM-dependent methyltransferase